MDNMKRVICTGLLCLMALWAKAGDEVKVPHRGYVGSVEAGFAAGAGDMAHDRGEILVVNGYRLNDVFSVGIGTGVQIWRVSQQVTLPLFADVEATFLQSVISPYADFRLGYCWGLSEDEMLPKDGLYISPTVGFRWGMGRNTAVKLGVGYLVQGSKIRQNFHTPNQFTETTFFHALVGKVAFEF